MLTDPKYMVSCTHSQEAESGREAGIKTKERKEMTILDKPKLRDANLKGMDLTGAVLIDADFTGAQLPSGFSLGGIQR